MSPTFHLSPHVQLVDVSTARAIIGRPSDEVIALVEEGRWLRWAFDVSAGGGQKRCIRIWRGSLLAWSSKQEDAATLAEVLDAVLLVKRLPPLVWIL